MKKINITLQIRNKFGITQEELAHVLGVSYTSVNAWEGGKRIPQEHMMTVLQELLEANELPSSSINIKEPQGLLRTDAGYVSSVIDYSNLRDQARYTHRIGRWFGSLPSFLVRDLLKFARTDFGVNGPVLANFCGSGTIPLEAALSGMDSYAIDVNTMAVMLSNLKTHPIELSWKEIEAAFHVVIQNRTLKVQNNNNPQKNLIVENSKWLSDSARLAVQEMCSGITQLDKIDLQYILAVALASIVIDFCNIDKRCTNHYVYKDRGLFIREKLEQTFLEELRSYYEPIVNLKSVDNYKPPNISLGDACALQYPDASMGIVFSHPPYGTTINYYSINRIPISVLDLISFKDKGTETSTTITECQKNDISSGTLRRFNSFTESWVREAYRVLKPGGIFISIIGDSRDNGRLSHPFTDIIACGEKIGFKTKELFIWVTNHKAGMHVKRKGNHIDHNYVIIMEK